MVYLHTTKEKHIEAQIEAKLDELRNHRGDGVATCADLVRVLEIIQQLCGYPSTEPHQEDSNG